MHSFIYHKTLKEFVLGTRTSQNLNNIFFPKGFYTTFLDEMIRWGLEMFCLDLSLGLKTKTRAFKGVSWEWSPWVTFHVLESVQKCEGMNPHTPKLGPPFGNWNPSEFPNFQRAIEGGQNSLDWKVHYTIGNILRHRYLKWAHMTHLGT
jgi:hypothetical protein